ncbi:MAG: hypothetical protein R2873_16475 [Caldilineaceae bacterium]|nr:hypothetical protein [Caldilineaceae bacterium]
MTASPQGRTLHLRRLPLLAAAILALLLGMWSGLLRLGWTWSGMLSHLPLIHGPLMVGGFLGTLISLERAVAVERRWAYAAPAATALGALALLVNLPIWVGALLITAGSLVTVAIFGVILRMQTALFTATIALGTLLWAVGNVLWLSGQAVPQVVLWWAAFLVFTIAGERLELSRLLRLTPTVQALFVAASALVITGLVLVLIDHALGSRVAGAGMVAISLWLLRFDIARRRIKAGGLARYIAFALITGYVWLGIGGLLALIHGSLWAGPYYDALLHAIFLGFAFSMIFGHAPIIFPAVLGLPIRYSDRFYSHLVLLHITLAVRVVGDLLLWMPVRQWGGLLNAIVLLLFLVNTLAAMNEEKRLGSAIVST